MAEEQDGESSAPDLSLIPRLAFMADFFVMVGFAGMAPNPFILALLVGVPFVADLLLARRVSWGPIAGYIRVAFVLGVFGFSFLDALASTGGRGRLR